VIEIDGEGGTVTNFADWTVTMVAVASMMWGLTPRHDSEQPRSHELGIDKLARRRYAGRRADSSSSALPGS
jgi:hypothetical protein